jgi:hypothetical protein
MTTVTDIGTRIELVPMDGHFQDITVALYRQIMSDAMAGAPGFLVHTYSGLNGSSNRLQQIADAMAVLGELEPIPGPEPMLRFSCGQEHNLAVRRAFLEACKLDPAETLAPRPLTILDRKSGLSVKIDCLGQGQYRVRTEGDDPEDQSARRIGVIVNGLLKLGEMRRVEVGGAEDCVAFPCGCPHDALVGLLLLRAPNVRAIVREQESMAARGVLSAPSALTE